MDEEPVLSRVVIDRYGIVAKTAREGSEDTS
jgi:hypothetical protein